MLHIVEKDIEVAFPQGHHLHALLCQIPNRIERSELGFRIADPDRQWARIASIFELVGTGSGNLKKLHFLLFPESSLPANRIDDLLNLVETKLHRNTVTIIGIEHIRLADYLKLLERFRADNEEALESVRTDQEAGEIEQIPVNFCLIVCKEDSGRLRVFFEAKSHPFVGEENLDPFHDLYRGKVFPLFRCHPTCYNFMALICLDYIYRDLYRSNISNIIDHANRLFHETRQRLDLLAVVQCNPKPEHAAFRDVLNGFYGEYLEYTPGVRDTITLFCNASGETDCEGLDQADGFGYSSAVIHKRHKLEKIALPEFSSDNFGGLPICRLRFGKDSRLFFFNLPVFHELDPRTTRAPLKIHSIFREQAEHHWTRIESDAFSWPTTENRSETN